MNVHDRAARSPATALPDALPDPEAASPDRLINREISWPASNHPVLEEAENARHPLLERLRFVPISPATTAESYSVPVPGHNSQAKAGVHNAVPDGPPTTQHMADGGRARGCGDPAAQ